MAFFSNIVIKLVNTSNTSSSLKKGNMASRVFGYQILISIDFHDFLL